MDKNILIVEDEFIIAEELSFMLKNADYNVCGIADSVEEALQLIDRHLPDLVLLDIRLKGRLTGIDLARRLGEMNISFVYLSANIDSKTLEEAKETKPYGFIVKPFREKDLLVAIEIAEYLHEQTILASKNSELLLQGALIDLIEEEGAWNEKLLKIAKALQSHIQFDYLAIGMKNLDTVPYHGRCFLRLGFNEYQVITPEKLISLTGIKRQDLFKLQEPYESDKESIFYNDKEFTSICFRNAEKAFIRHQFKMASNFSAFIPVKGYNGFTMSFYSRKNDNYNHRQLLLMKRLHSTLSPAINGILYTSTACKQRAMQRVTLSQPKVAKNKGKLAFEGIVGSSQLLATALDQVTLVAPMETAVLILGESGTGKERFARLVHSFSARKGKPLVTVNCAALPANLTESELFGHEKGAFTGAIERRIGKFEQATGGTIFLDEIGDLPLESQAKLLRVLQEKEIERLGGRETIKVDVRVVAATNCNLEKQVAEGKFRLDLYYRLNIFPIVLPSLRDRKEDLPELANYFVHEFALRAGKADMSISIKALNELANYNWPGNVRELEHLIERSVLLTKGNTIEQVGIMNKAQRSEDLGTDHRIKTINENERDHILSVLKKCNGRISGPAGAAELLDVPSTTLNSKMKRLGLTRTHSRSI